MAAPLKAMDSPARLADWVDAAPFRALLRYLIDQTGLPWYAMPAATRTPFRMVRTLLFGNRNQPVKRIRYLDARNLMQATATTMLTKAAVLVDASASVARLPHLPEPPTAAELTLYAGIESQWATGLVEGSLTKCPRHVVWRTMGYIEMKEGALLQQSRMKQRADATEQPLAMAA